MSRKQLQKLDSNADAEVEKRLGRDYDKSDFGKTYDKKYLKSLFGYRTEEDLKNVSFELKRYILRNLLMYNKIFEEQTQKFGNMINDMGLLEYSATWRDRTNIGNKVFKDETITWQSIGESRDLIGFLYELTTNSPDLYVKKCKPKRYFDNVRNCLINAEEFEILKEYFRIVKDYFYPAASEKDEKSKKGCLTTFEQKEREFFEKYKGEHGFGLRYNDFFGDSNYTII